MKLSAQRGEASFTLNPLNPKTTAAAATPPKPAAAAGERGEGKKGNGERTTDPTVSERRKALAVAGIGEPVRTELANRPLTPEQIREATSKQANVKFLIGDLRALADQAEARAEERIHAKRRAEIAQEPPVHHRRTPKREPEPRPTVASGPSCAWTVRAKVYDDDHDPRPRSKRGADLRLVETG